MALGDLKEVLVWFVRAKLSREVEEAISFNFLDLRSDDERIFDPNVRGFIVNFEQRPVHFDWEWKLVLQCKLLAVANSTHVGEIEIYEVLADLDIPFVACHVQKHLFVQHDLAWVIDWDLLVHVH